MTIERYDLIFSGELARGAELAQAKRNLANLFKITEAKAEALFSGKPIVLKKDLDFATGNKYRVAIKKAGCLVELREKKAPVAPKSKAVFAVSGEASSSASAKSPSEALVAPELRQKKVALAQNEVGNTAQAEVGATSSSSLNLAPIGSDVLNENERQHVDPLEMDLSALTIDEAGGYLLHDDELTRVEERDIHVDASLAPVGAALIQASERESVAPLDVAIPDISLAAVGALLEQEKDEKPKLNPDISHLSLE